jgi:hypothetical protein
LTLFYIAPLLVLSPTKAVKSMDKYLQVSYYTLTGIRKLIDLGDFSYGEWIVYDGDLPKYHINVHTQYCSDMAINSIINKKSESIESILKKINIRHTLNLNLGRKPCILLVKKEEHIDLELIPLPDYLVENI